MKSLMTVLAAAAIAGACACCFATHAHASHDNGNGKSQDHHNQKHCPVVTCDPAPTCEDGSAPSCDDGSAPNVPTVSGPTLVYVQPVECPDLACPEPKPIALEKCSQRIRKGKLKLKCGWKHQPSRTIYMQVPVPDGY